MWNAIVALVLKVRALSKMQRVLLLVFVAVVCFLLLGQAGGPHLKRTSSPIAELQQTENWPAASSMSPDSLVDDEKQKDLREPRKESAESRVDGNRLASVAMPYATPLIAHTAELAVATHEFAKSRTSLEEILERHRGYAARLRMAGRRSGSVLSATLRVPTSELANTVSDLKSLGDVEQEEQAADEITQQRADLEARLANAQGTLRRLQELLKKQTYPDGNVRELQRQIANASAEVNRLQAERDASEHKIIFANVQFSMREVVSAPTESLGEQLHAAAAAGFGEASASLSAIVLFLIGRGPVALLWMLILYFPARLVWRRWLANAIPAAPVAQV
jgi:DNA repair exonuclease SbcCD ATPase subunit